jgi:hypothetical protein
MAVESFEPFKDFPRDEKLAEQFRSGMRQEYAAALETVEELAKKLDAEYAFECVVTYQLSKITGGYEEIEHGAFPALIELAAFYLSPRFGLGGERDPGQIQALIDSLDKLNSLRVFVAGLDVGCKKITKCVIIDRKVQAGDVRWKEHWPILAMRRRSTLVGHSLTSFCTSSRSTKDIDVSESVSQLSIKLGASSA